MDNGRREEGADDRGMYTGVITMKADGTDVRKEELRK